MFVRRLTASLKQQHWMTIAIELMIVIIGVFIGNQVSNWNQSRIERAQTQRMIEQLVPELDSQLLFFSSAKVYYATTRRYADDAFRGWRGDPHVNNEQFVIAAYQASQIFGIGTNAQNWAVTFGGGQLRSVDDYKLRRDLALVMTADYDNVSFNSVATPYREKVRRVIPVEIQDRIRAECGDRNIFKPDMASVLYLPATCELRLDARKAAAAAAKLRSHPDLVDELQWHLAAVATYLANVEVLERQMQTLKRSIEGK